MSTVAMRFHHFVQNSLTVSIESQVFTSVKSLRLIHIIDFADTTLWLPSGGEPEKTTHVTQR
ncbi:hypothetical protein DWV21_06275 [Bifidobacterium longum]|nr:hypothetical protein DWV25_06300 [Bifidobacterium longum]RGX39622.1 hypothetical protein DWV23_06570 [Bifidobacterium longum]RGX47061.1 hypothetical protein DWV21_06275 [Bifidobacterium longum]RHB45135.1 hypothetical protein DW883_00445 [Bifidobacterium longum]